MRCSAQCGSDTAPGCARQGAHMWALAMQAQVAERRKLIQRARLYGTDTHHGWNEVALRPEICCEMRRDRRKPHAEARTRASLGRNFNFAALVLDLTGCRIGFG